MSGTTRARRIASLGLAAALALALMGNGTPASAASKSCAHIRCTGKAACTIRVKDVRKGGVREATIPRGRVLNITKARKGDQWCQVVGTDCVWNTLPLGACA